MYHTVLILIAFTALLIIRGVIALIFDPPMPEKGQVKLFKLLPIIGVPCGALFLIPTCITLFTGESPWLSAGFLAFSWLGCSLIVGYLNCTITYSDDTFTVKNFLGFKRTYSYQDIDKIRHTPNHDWLYIGRRRVLVDALAINGDRFLDTARKRYRTSHGGKPIPSAPCRKWDLFKGNVRDPGQKLFGLVLIYVVLLVVLVLLLIFGAPKSENDLEYTTITPIDCVIQNDSLRLHVAETDTYYRVTPYQALLDDVDTFLKLCESGEKLAVGVRYYSSADDPFYDIYTIEKADGTVLLSLETANQVNQQIISIGWYMLSGFFSFGQWWWF